MKPIIEVTDLSKSYQISHQEKASYDTIKDDFAKLIKKPFGGGSDSQIETFWALKDINFEVNPGEIFGIIGKNGSGKSTLLKILSRIVEPDSGTARIQGKVASLLEVGTGFHPELTGRENIYFNGSMLGMSKQEITKKFDQIVDFSEVEKFLDTPVKFYSSGMFVRLAFSVAAHLDSDILILDEVLSVGDVAFQKKSLSKMVSVVKEGRTILFVSHSMTAVKQLCSKAMLLERGKIKFIGETEFVTDEYLMRTMHKQTKDDTSFTAKEPAKIDTEDKSKAKQKAKLLQIELRDLEGNKVHALNLNQPWQMHIKYKILEPCEKTMVSIEILTNEDQPVYITADTDDLKRLPTKQPGTYEATVIFGAITFVPGVFYIRTAIQQPGITVHDIHEGMPLRIRQNESDIRTSYFKGKYMGYLSSKINWEVNKQS